MAKAKTPKYLHNGPYQIGAATHYVRAWKEKREWIVQVWMNKAAPEGEPEGAWEMPGAFSMAGAIEQSVMQS